MLVRYRRIQTFDDRQRMRDIRATNIYVTFQTVQYDDSELRIISASFLNINSCISQY